MVDHTYRMVLSWSETDGAWLVEVPELPGAMADGATPEEAVAHAERIIKEWLEVAREDGRSIPTPKSLAPRP